MSRAIRARSRAIVRSVFASSDVLLPFISVLCAYMRSIQLERVLCLTRSSKVCSMSSRVLYGHASLYARPLSSRPPSPTSCGHARCPFLSLHWLCPLMSYVHMYDMCVYMTLQYVCMYVCMYVCKYVCMDGWMDGCMDVCMYGMYGCMYVWMDGWMEGWMTLHAESSVLLV